MSVDALESPAAGAGGAVRVRHGLAILLAIAALALVARIVPITVLHYLTASDEIFQYYEQAHRLVFGSGLVPWEYHQGTRTWLLALLLAAGMWASSLFSSTPETYFLLCRTLLAGLSLSIVLVAFRAGPQDRSPAARLAGALFCAVFVDLAYFGAAALTEVVATHLVFIALLVHRGRWIRGATGQFIALGMLLGLAVWMRIQLAPLALVLALYLCGLDLGRWLRLAGGGAVALGLAGGLLDTLTWGVPFHSAWANVNANLVMDVASSFGISPIDGYATMAAERWSAGALVVAGLCVLGARRQPIFLLCGLVVVASHSLVPHKEWRFMYPAIAFFAVSAGIGLGDLADRVARAGWIDLRRPMPLASLAGLAAIVVFAFSWQATGGAPWTREAGNQRVLAEIRNDPALCGVRVKGIDWGDTGGYATFHRDIPIYFSTLRRVDHFPTGLEMRTSVIVKGEELGKSGPYNVLIAQKGGADESFTERRCFAHGGKSGSEETCIYDRVAGCAP